MMEKAKIICRSFPEDKKYFEVSDEYLKGLQDMKPDEYGKISWNITFTKPPMKVFIEKKILYLHDAKKHLHDILIQTEKVARSIYQHIKEREAKNGTNRTCQV